MTQYDKLDLLIYEAIKAGANEFASVHVGDVHQESLKISVATGRPAFRIVDARLQAIKRRGLIEFNRRRGGWVIKDKA
jgi:hypothetical protein